MFATHGVSHTYEKADGTVVDFSKPVRYFNAARDLTNVEPVLDEGGMFWLGKEGEAQ